MTAMEKLEKKMKSLLSASGGRPGWSVSVVEAFAQFYIRQGVEYAEMKPLDMSQMHASVQRQTQSARPPVLLLLEGRSKPTTSVDCRGTQCVASYHVRLAEDATQETKQILSGAPNGYAKRLRLRLLLPPTYATGTKKHGI
ncbi:hypothetical protein NQ176_g8572 [Zarea fungicola]|uniref:Uncharacterized protein n=1 Tax=Zarea fungicola TaxID=93591 RepID=A0ACC1MRH6_9HYPO|nr:hypothetical protein NQ176_g8572 [Lecanicillium fungicola]